jgi:hypothetical protein
MAEQEEIIIEVNYETDEAQKNIDNLTDSIFDLSKKNKQLSDENKDLNKQLKKNSQDLKKSNEELKSEGKSRDQLRKKINDQTSTLKKNFRQIEQNKDAIKKSRRERDQSRKSITGEKSAFDKLTDAIKDGNKQRQSQIDKLEEMPGAAGGVIGSIKGMTKAALKFIATPLGAVLAAIVGVMALLKKAFNRNEEAQQKLRVITSKLSGVFNFLLKILQPLVEFLIDQVAVAFETVSKVADKAIGLLSKGLKLLGFEEAAEQVEKFKEQIEDTVEDTEELTKAQNRLNKARRNSRLIQLQFQKDAEKLRQIRDDESRSIRERMLANEELGAVLRKQLNEELKIANLALKVANLRIKAEGEGKETLDQKAEALTEIADIEERITGQQSEQLVNINSLRREEAALAEERAKARKEEEEQREEDFKRELDRQVQAQILKNEIAKADIERDKLDKQEQLETSQQFLNDSLDLFGANYDERFLVAQKLSNSILDLQKAELDGQKAGLAEYATIAAGVTTDLLAFRKQSLDNEAISVQENLDRQINAFEEGSEIRKILERKKAQQLYEIELKQFRANKAIAVVQAAINTALAVTKLGVVTPQGIAAAILGAAQVTFIATRKPPPAPTFKKGGSVKTGIFKGKSHSQGGVNLRDDSGNLVANVERDEGFFVVNRKDTQRIQTLSDINSVNGRPFSRTRFAQEGGEIPTESTNIQDEIRKTPIVVRVEDIKTGLEERENVINAGVV